MPFKDVLGRISPTAMGLLVLVALLSLFSLQDLWTAARTGGELTAQAAVAVRDRMTAEARAGARAAVAAQYEFRARLRETAQELPERLSPAEGSSRFRSVTNWLEFRSRLLGAWLRGILGELRR